MPPKWFDCLSWVNRVGSCPSAQGQMIRPSRSWSRRENATDRPAPRRRVSRRRVVAHSAGTGWRANDTTYRRGDGVFAARFPSDDLGLSRFRAAYTKIELISFVRDSSRAQAIVSNGSWVASDAARRTSAALQHRARRQIAFDLRRLVQLQRSLCDVPCETPTRAPQNSDHDLPALEPRYANSDGIGGKIGFER